MGEERERRGAGGYDTGLRQLAGSYIRLRSSAHPPAHSTRSTHSTHPANLPPRLTLSPPPRSLSSFLRISLSFSIYARSLASSCRRCSSSLLSTFYVTEARHYLGTLHATNTDDYRIVRRRIIVDTRAAAWISRRYDSSRGWVTPSRRIFRGTRASIEWEFMFAGGSHF